MKAKRTFAAALAATLSLSALSGLAVHAESAYALGDVDMDGVITGHDSAMVSRYLNVDSELFTEEQLELADFNGDGTIDQTDADLIHENEVYALGDIAGIGSLSLQGAYIALMCYGTSQTTIVNATDNGMTELPTCYEVSTSHEQIATEEAYWLHDDYWLTPEEDGLTIDTLIYNLMDADGDGTVSLDDATALLIAYAMDVVSSEEDEETYFINGRYDLVDSVLYTHPTIQVKAY